MSPLRFIFTSHPKPRPHSNYHHRRTFTDFTTIKWVRDRGLDHAVEREKNLNPLINIKNLIKSEPSKSLPITIIAENRESLKIPTRPIEFVRKYPSIFQEFLPGGIGFQPHIRLTPEVLDLDAEEQLMYQSESYKQQVADRLLKLLMLCRTNKMPLTLVERLKWDLGLPQDYGRSLIPEFPDYFRIGVAKDCSSGPVLELVCWISEMGTSVMERKVMKGGGYSKGMPTSFPMQFSRGFEMDKKMKKWVDDWQKLPYVSPYENAAHLSPKSDESDKWAVAVLHEFLHILVPKKTERENVLCLGEYLGVRSRFKRALLQHPGIFYLSSKIDTYTLVLKEGYKRGLLVENHPLMNMRSKYIHLMNTLKEDSKTISVPSGSGRTQKQKQTTSDFKGGQDEEEEESEEENEGQEFYDSSDAEEDEDDSQQGVEEDVSNNRGRTRKTNSDVKGHVRNPERRSAGKHPGKSREKYSPEVSSRTKMHNRMDVKGRVRNPERRSAGKHTGKSREKYSPEVSASTDMHDRSSRGRTSRTGMQGRSLRGPEVSSRTEMHDRSSRGRTSRTEMQGRSLRGPEVSSRTEMHNRSLRGRTSRTEMQGRSLRGRSDFSKSRGRSMPNKTPS